MSMLILAAMSATTASQTPQEIRPANPANIEANLITLMKYYPPRALAAGEEGLVGFTITIDRDAHPTACQVTFTSGHPKLDEETCSLVLSHAVFQPTYDSNKNRVATVREGVINWKLPTTSRSAIPAIPAPVTAANTPEKLVCKRRQRSDNLAAYERVCMSKRDWDRERQVSRDALEAEQGVKGFSTGITIGGTPGG